MAGNITGKEEMMTFGCKWCPNVVVFAKGFEPALHLCQECHTKGLAEFWRIWHEAGGEVAWARAQAARRAA